MIRRTAAGAEGARTFHVTPWRISEGTITTRLTVFDGYFELW